jgi:putative ABC transport system permease protein
MNSGGSGRQKSTMDYLGLAIRNLRRNSTRTLLTILSTAFSMFVISALVAFSGSADRVTARTASSVRIAVHNKAGLTYLVPDVYKRTIATLPHVEAVAAQTWFGGLYRDISDQFGSLAIDPDSIEKIWPDWGVSPVAIGEFKRSRIGCLVGRITMQNHGWKIGQQIMLRGTEYPVKVALTIVGTLGPNGVPDLVVFRRDYLKQTAGRAGQVSLIWVKVDSARYVPQVIGAIDETFANSDHETKSESEAPFLGSFLSSCRMLIKFARLLCLLVLAAMVLVCANSSAMSIRERQSEIAVMRAIGFAPCPLAIMMMAECIIIGACGGLVGCAAASFLCHAVVVMPAFGFIGAIEFPFWLIAQGIAASIFTAAAGGLFPVIRAIRGDIANRLRENATV